MRTTKTAAWPHTKTPLAPAGSTSTKPIDESTQRGAGDVADATEHGRGERLQPGLEAEGELDVAEVESLDHAGGPRRGPIR